MKCDGFVIVLQSSCNGGLKMVTDVRFQRGAEKVSGHMYNMGLLLKTIRERYEATSRTQWSLQAIADRIGISRAALSHIDLLWDKHEAGEPLRLTSLTETVRLYALALLYPVALDDEELAKANVMITKLARDELPNGKPATKESIIAYAEALVAERMPYIVALAVKERAGAIDRTTIGEAEELMQRSGDTEAAAALEVIRAAIAANRTAALVEHPTV